jgi:hypothetical protein
MREQEAEVCGGSLGFEGLKRNKIYQWGPLVEANKRINRRIYDL